MADRQLPLEPTERIDPRTQATLVPGHDAVCMCADDVEGAYECRWPFCGGWKEPLRCPRCGEPLTPDWVGDPKVGWCSPCNLWNFEYKEDAREGSG